MSSPLPFRYGTTVVPLRTIQEVQCAVAGLFGYDKEYLKLHPLTPKLYAAGIKYKREQDIHSRLERKWRVIPIILQAKESDCKGLAAWRAAELCAEGIDARTGILEFPDMLHIVVIYKDHTGRERMEDPSLRLGMPAPAGYPVELL